jgi:hypothetical protein
LIYTLPYKDFLFVVKISLCLFCHKPNVCMISKRVAHRSLGGETCGQAKYLYIDSSKTFFTSTSRFWILIYP